MELWGIELETNKRHIFILIIKVTVTCCWGQRCKFEEGLNKSQNQCRLVVPWWFLLCISSLAQQLHNQFLHETERIYHGTRSGINHAPFLHTFLKDPLLVSGLSGPFIRQIRAVSLTRIGYNKTTVNTSCQEHKKSWDTKNPRTPLFLLLCCFRTTSSYDGIVQNGLPDAFTLVSVTLDFNSFGLSWNTWDWLWHLPTNKNS